MKSKHSTFKCKVMQCMVQKYSIIPMLQVLRWKSKNSFIHSEERDVINLVLVILESLVVLVAKVIEVEMTWEQKYNSEFPYILFLS